MPDLYLDFPCGRSSSKPNPNSHRPVWDPAAQGSLLGFKPGDKPGIGIAVRFQGDFGDRDFGDRD
ncbi:hypothetical protein, partial [Prochlorothrix hollandica]|uniref:hypothetical protein n=1 Tax=Prochlorothrix hollandica TaxID=1223 RepID=UPI00333EEBA1